MPKFSIIIPVYKVEKYLVRCVDSILNQTYKDFELILVDDGSPDSSGKICDEYAAKDSRVMAIHQKNGGASSARNTGIDSCTGDYILFVDSDDYIDIDFVEHFADNISDFTACGTRKVNESGEVVLTVKYDSVEFNSADKIDFSLLFSCSEIYSPYCKLFNAKVVKENHICFPVGKQWGEDGCFVSDYLAYVDSVRYLEYVGYNYVRYKSESTLSTVVRPELIDLVVETRTYSIDKIAQISPDQLEKVKDIIEDNIIFNAADFVKRTFTSKKMDRAEKKKVLAVFLGNEYVKKSIVEKSESYTPAELKALKSSNPSMILFRYNFIIKSLKLRKYIRKKFSYLKEILHIS